jgi:hypothetical protein
MSIVRKDWLGNGLGLVGGEDMAGRLGGRLEGMEVWVLTCLHEV